MYKGQYGHLGFTKYNVSPKPKLDDTEKNGVFYLTLTAGNSLQLLLSMIHDL